MPYQLPDLDYSYDALEPCVDAETLRLHHDIHHRGYVDLLNSAIARYPQFDNMAIEDLLARLSEVPADVREAVRDGGGGHANHDLLWKTLGPPNDIRPNGMLAEAIRKDFGTFEKLLESMTEAAATVFGSGWVFLATDPMSQNLEIISLPNQDTPLFSGKSVLLACDLWEHSYYLRYRNRRSDYLKAFWNIVQWNTVNSRLENLRHEAWLRAQERIPA